MSTSRCFRRIQYRALRSRKRIQKMALYGTAGAAVGALAGGALQVLQNKAMTIPCYEKSSWLMDYIVPHHIKHFEVAEWYLQDYMLAFYLTMMHSALWMTCEAVETPIRFVSQYPIFFGALAGAVKGWLEPIPPLGEEPILPEQSFSDVSRSYSKLR